MAVSDDRRLVDMEPEELDEFFDGLIRLVLYEGPAQ
jgi:hypothetical protein